MSDQRESPTPTPWAVLCQAHGQVFLTEAEYDRQLMRPDSVWECPRAGCSHFARWDDDNYEAAEGRIDR
jgi:hypothetical protein